jgi:hypothetical protein
MNNMRLVGVVSCDKFLTITLFQVIPVLKSHIVPNFQA